MKTSSNPKKIAWSAFLAVALYFVLPASMPELGKRTVCIFAAAVMLWVSEALPLYATSLCVVALEILFLAEKGGLAREGGISFKQFLDPFASDIIILFMGGFMLSKAMTKHGVDSAIASRLLYPMARGPLTLVYGVLLVTAALSMWMSNTATAAMMLAITAPLLKKIPESDRFRGAIALAVPFGANIGGIGTPIGTPPNAICMAILRGAGYKIGFLDWVAFAVPLMLIILAAAGLVIYLLHRPQTGFSQAAFKIESRPLTANGKTVLAVLGLTIALWLTTDWHGLNEGAVALLAFTLLAVLENLDFKDIRSIEWDILILMWGGLSLSSAMTLSGLTGWFSGLPLSGLSPRAMDAFFIVFSIGLSTFMSNTASANIVTPLALAAAKASPVSAAILAAIGSSLDIALPVSTPPNALAYATGAVTAKQMLRASIIITAVSIPLLLIWSRYVLPLFSF